MGTSGYRVVELDDPSEEAFHAALAEVGLEWPDRDILGRHNHPGMRMTDGTIALILHPVRFDERTDDIVVVQVELVLGHEAAVVARASGDGLDHAFAPAHDSRRDLILALVEEVFDLDAEAITAIEERVDDIELEVLDAAGNGATAQSIYHLEHELLKVRRAVGPMVTVLDRLGRRADADDQLEVFEWQERFHRLVSQMEDVDNLLTSILGVNLTLASVRQNEDMRKIAAWGAIGIAPTAMAGIWGMNFENMPELGWEIGYPVALASIATVCFLLYRFFKRAGWL
jgi:magnesium transporter